MPDKLSSFAWCQWTNWIEECRLKPEHIIVLGVDDRPANINYEQFRVQACQWAQAKGCRAHVNINRQRHVIRMQFCWREDYHQRLHVDGASLRSEAELQYWAPWPPNTPFTHMG